MIIIITIIASLFLFFIIRFSVKSKARKLQRNFIALGNMTGKSKSEIVAKCGNPNTIRNMQNGSICVWATPGYIMTLQFDINERFVKICSETAV